MLARTRRETAARQSGGRSSRQERSRARERARRRSALNCEDTWSCGDGSAEHADAVLLMEGEPRGPE
eukprot:3388117-Rhodomonas_salina.5